MLSGCEKAKVEGRLALDNRMHLLLLLLNFKLYKLLMREIKSFWICISTEIASKGNKIILDFFVCGWFIYLLFG